MGKLAPDCWPFSQINEGPCAGLKKIKNDVITIILQQYVGLDKAADECGKQSRKVYTFNEDEVVGLIKLWRMDEADNNSDTEDEEEEEKPDASTSSSKSSLKRDNVLTEEVVDIINKLRTDEKIKDVRYKRVRQRFRRGTNGVFKKRYYGNAKSGNALLSSEDEQFEDALTNPKISAVSTIPRSKEEHENFHNLNSEFSERMGKFSNNSAERVQLLKLMLHNLLKSDITHPDETYGPSQLYLGFYQPSPGVFFYEYNEPDEMIDLIIMVLVVNDDNYTPDQPVQAIIDITAFDSGKEIL
ncbi:hypothetical protein RhiirA4_441558 [Rhizophagus irregularis]|uniref:Uncharacterized protein n=1 Tax=Rhizophagus irregularis TaxID=588596 RepID=A0A2I1G5C3_9GLOM|nr:hypothetical protein RhiirA4_441558 [Rhizophagus irregularis]